MTATFVFTIIKLVIKVVSYKSLSWWRRRVGLLRNSVSPVKSSCSCRDIFVAFVL